MNKILTQLKIFFSKKNLLMKVNNVNIAKPSIKKITLKLNNINKSYNAKTTNNLRKKIENKKQ